MQNYARDEAGNVWEVDAQGNAVRLVEQGGGAGYGFIQTRPADPYAAPKAQAEITGTNLRNQQMANELANSGRGTIPAGFRLTADGQNLEPIPGGPADKSVSRTPQQILAERAQIDNTLSKVAEARALIRKGGTTGWGGYLANLPGTDARSLRGALSTLESNLAFDRLQEMRNNSPTGGALGAVSERELMLLGSTVANISDQMQDAETLLNNLDAIENNYKRFQASISGVDPDTDEGRAVMNSALGKPAPRRAGGPNEGTPTIGFANRYATENDRKFATLAQARFDRGATRQEMDALAQQYGYPAFGPELDVGLQARAQGRPVEIGAPESGYNDPSIAQRAFQSIAASPVGTYFGQAANALTMGGLDEIQGVMAGDSFGEAFAGTGANTAEANLRKSLQSDANPIASGLGNLSGGLLAALGTGGLTGGLSATGTLAPRAIAGDALFGAGYGAGESNDNRLAGAGMGATAAIGGGIFGRGLTRKIGQAVGGVQGPAQVLREGGVTNLTPGQIAASSDGTLGRMIKRREDRLAGFSGIGDAIANQQRRGSQQFVEGSWRQGIDGFEPPLTGVGEEIVDSGREAVEQAYNRALSGRQFNANDPSFVQGIGGAVRRAQAVPTLGEEAAYSIRQSVEPFIDASGALDGKGMQRITQNLRRRGAAFDKHDNPVGPDAAASLRDAYDSVAGMVQRQSPDAWPAFQGANRDYGNFKILEAATGKATNTEGLFTPAQLGMAARDSAKKFGGNFAGTARPFFDWQRAGQQILPSKIPDSGTAGRQAAGDGITGVLKSVARNARLPLYSDPAIEMMNYLALQRPDTAKALGRSIQDRARLGGIFGAPLLLPAIE